MKFRLAITLVAALAGGTALAQEVKPTVPDITQFDQRLQSLIRESPAEAITTLTHQLFQIAPDGILNESVRQEFAAAQSAERLSSRIAPMLALDLNFDGMLSAEEIDRARNPVNLPRPFNRPQFEVLVLLADKDEDGIVTWDELRIAVIDQYEAQHRSSGALERFGTLMLLDLNGDGVVNAREIIEAVRLMEP